MPTSSSAVPPTTSSKISTSCQCSRRRLVELEHRELRVVTRRQAFVAKGPADLEDPLDAADDASLQVQLGRDSEIHVGVEGVVMVTNGRGGGAARLSGGAPGSRPLRSRRARGAGGSRR